MGGAVLHMEENAFICYPKGVDDLGYQITYENGTMRKQTLRRRRIKWKRLGIGLSAAAMAVTMLVPQGRLWLRDLILPGDEEVTAAALEEMVSDLRDGQPIGEVVEAFCREIIAGGA